MPENKNHKHIHLRLDRRDYDELLLIQHYEAAIPNRKHDLLKAYLIAGCRHFSSILNQEGDRDKKPIKIPSSVTLFNLKHMDFQEVKPSHHDSSHLKKNQNEMVRFERSDEYKKDEEHQEHEESTGETINLSGLFGSQD